jgi:hypothetical protein
MNFDEKLRSIPAPGNGCHAALLGAANFGIVSGLTPERVFQRIRDAIPSGSRVIPDDEIRQAVKKAHRENKPGQAVDFKTADRRPEAPGFDAAQFMARMQDEGSGADEDTIGRLSPVPIDWAPEQGAVETLRRLYSGNDYLFCGNRYDTKVQSVDQWIREFEDGVLVPPHIIPNPLTGAEGLTKDGKDSYRADSCVQRFGFAVAEFDKLSRNEQIRFWYAVDLPVVALIDSGNKSLHAWLRVDGIDTNEQWTRRVEQELFCRFLNPLGCDSACRNEARLSRMPGHLRSENNRWQRMLYLCPEGRRVRQCRQ